MEETFSEFVDKANKAICALTDKMEISKCITEHMNELRIRYNKDPENYPWDMICNWYTTIQRVCELPFIDQYACLYPSIIDIDEIKKSTGIDIREVAKKHNIDIDEVIKNLKK